MRRCVEQILPRLDVKVSVQGQPFVRVSLNFTQIFLLVKRCAEPMTRLHILNVKVTLQGNVIYPSIRVRSISPEPFEVFSLNFTQMFLSVRRCAEHITQLPRLNVKVTGQCQVIDP